jgi:NAD(P)-dependent dehydrogenase (short-subunit alcohol dehydrogenase family)
MELGEHGVRVNCVLPGFIPTPMIGLARGLSAEEAEEKLRVVEEAFTGAQPIRGPGAPVDVARAALWLASDDSAFVNGHALVVDGGASGGRMWSTYQEAVVGLEERLRERTL